MTAARSNSRYPRALVFVGLPAAIIMASAMFARAFDTTWIASGQTLSASQLKADLDEAQSRIATLEQQMPAVTEWQSYTPAVTRDGGATVGSQTTTGRYRRVGDSIEVSINTGFSGAPSSGATWWQWSLPTGLVIDTTKLTCATCIVGSGMAELGASNNFALAVYVRSTKGVSATANGASNYYINDTTPFAWANGAGANFVFTVPIAGWTVSH